MNPVLQQEIERLLTTALRSGQIRPLRGGMQQVFDDVVVLYATPSGEQRKSRAAFRLKYWPPERQLVVQFVWAGPSPNLQGFTIQHFEHLENFSLEEPDEEDCGSLALKLLVINRQ